MFRSGFLVAAIAVVVAGTPAWAQGPAAPAGNADAAAAAAKAPAKTKPAADKPAGEDRGEARRIAELKKALLAKFPSAEIRHVARTPWLGLYEVLLDGQMIYTDAKASMVLVGALFDTDKRINLTQERLQELTAVDWKELPLELAIKTVKGNGSRKLVVFSDVDCPYCKRLEQELKNVDDVTIYTFLFPIAQLHPDATRKSKLVWCASDRQKAYADIMADGKAPASDASCDDPVARIVALGERFRIQATPTLIFADGRLVPGALPKEQLEAQFARAAASIAKKTQ